MDGFDITVGLCTYSGSDLLVQTLRSLEAQETNGRFPFEILAIDDGSTEDTHEAVREFARCSSVRVRNEQNDEHGIGPAPTKVVRESTVTWTAYLDDDERAKKSWRKAR